MDRMYRDDDIADKQQILDQLVSPPPERGRVGTARAHADVAGTAPAHLGPPLAEHPLQSLPARPGGARRPPDTLQIIPNVSVRVRHAF